MSNERDFFPFALILDSSFTNGKQFATTHENSLEKERCLESFQNQFFFRCEVRVINRFFRGTNFVTNRIKCNKYNTK